MTRTAKGWREVMLRFRANADDAERAASRYGKLADIATGKKDSFVADTYEQAGYRALAEADWWRDRAAIAEGYSLDPGWTVTFTVVETS